MTYLRSLGLFFWIIVVAVGISSLSPETLRAQDSLPLQEVLLKVDGISCFTCRLNIESKLSGLPGVKYADVTSSRLTWWNPFSKSEGKALIRYEAGLVTIEQMIETIEQTSDAIYTYKASLFPEHPPK